MAKTSKRSSGTNPAIDGDDPDNARSGGSVAESIASLASEAGHDGSEIEENPSNGGDAIVTPEAGGERIPELDAGPARRRRGRPKGSGTKSPKVDLKDAAAKVSDFVNKVGDEGKRAVSEVLLMATNFFAMTQGEELWKIDEDEAKRVGEPLAEVLAEWGIRFDGIASPYARLIAASVSVYGVRAVMVAAKRKAAKPKPSAPKPDMTTGAEFSVSNIMQFPDMGQPN